MLALAQRVEALEANPPMVSTFEASDIGALATRRLFLVTSEMKDLGLTAWQAATVTLASEGHTNLQAADNLEIDMDEFHHFRNGALRTLGVTNMSVAVDIAIKKDIIPIEVHHDLRVLKRLRGHDARMLRFFARGGTLEHLQKANRKPSHPMKYYVRYEKELFEKVGAWTRPHAVRRGHELGIMKAPRPRRNG